MTTSKMKSYRMTGIAIARMEKIKEMLEEMYGYEVTETEIVKLAIQELFKQTQKEYTEWKDPK